MDPYASSVYRQNFENNNSNDNTLIEADILDLCAIRDIPHDTDILTGGFPCQPFSARGKQRGFHDDRGQLYREIVRVLRACHPKSFIFENVAGLASMGEGGGGRYQGRSLPRTRGEAGSVFQTILTAFQNCGYTVLWIGISAILATLWLRIENECSLLAYEMISSMRASTSVGIGMTKYERNRVQRQLFEI